MFELYPTANQVASVGAYTVTGTHARVSIVLTLRVVFLVPASVLRGVLMILGEEYTMLCGRGQRCGCAAVKGTSQGSWPWHRDQTKRGGERTAGTLQVIHFYLYKVTAIQISQ